MLPSPRLCHFSGSANPPSFVIFSRHQRSQYYCTTSNIICPFHVNPTFPSFISPHNVTLHNVMTPLVDYGSSEGEEEEEPQTATLPIPTESTDKLKRKYDDTIPESTLPPLPSTFHNLYASNTRLSVRDDPNLHGGRTRVTPHIEGNWPTHLYIECMHKPLPINT